MKDIDQKYYCSDYYDVSVNKYGVKCGTSLRVWENKGWINEIDPYGWFQWYFRYWLGRRSKDDERQINRWRKIVSRFRGKLVMMIKDAGSKYDNYSTSHKFRQIFLGLWINWKRFFLLTWQTNIQKWAITGLIDKKSCKKQKKDTPKKMLLNIILKTKKQ